MLGEIVNARFRGDGSERAMFANFAAEYARFGTEELHEQARRKACDIVMVYGLLQAMEVVSLL